jgi:hypothetical protein
MSSTYTSKYIIPGRRAGPIKQIINYKKCDTINSESNEYTPTQPFIITSGSPSIDYSNGYYTITFLDNGGIKFLVPLTSEGNDFNALVVGGGGGGGQSGNSFGTSLQSGAGGGAGGGVIYNSISLLENLNYNVIVGQGGNPHGQGSPSSFSNIIANGGNVGQDATNVQGGNPGIGQNGGGSGGYGGSYGSSSPFGPVVPKTPATNGNNGTAITINSITNYYGGGGGGGSYQFQGGSASGGLGGGGGGGGISNIGKPNTGGGGGGGNGNPFIITQGGVGGSGIVILHFKYSPTKITTNNTGCKVCVCPSPINSKIVKNSNPDVIPGSTQRERVVNAIRYSSGRVVFGNAPYNSNGDTLLGRLQGQPLPKFLSMNRF